MKKVLFIYNPHAGMSRSWSSLQDIIGEMTARDCLVTAYPTQRPGDAGEAVVRWARDYDQIVVAGGDGTLDEAVSGILRLPEAPDLGYIPVGTTNDFSKNLHLPLGNLRELAAAAVTGDSRRYDLGRFNGRSFLYVAAFGAFTQVSYSTPQELKNVLGYGAYVLESIKAIGSIKPSRITVEYDGGTITGDYVYGMVSNTTSVGSFKGFPPAEADLGDGKLELTLIPPLRHIQSLGTLSLAALRSDPHLARKVMTCVPVTHARITCESGLRWTLDGEDGGDHTEAVIDVLPGAFRVRQGNEE